MILAAALTRSHDVLELVVVVGRVGGPLALALLDLALGLLDCCFPLFDALVMPSALEQVRAIHAVPHSKEEHALFTLLYFTFYRNINKC
jgi:hypothetical protein